MNTRPFILASSVFFFVAVSANGQGIYWESQTVGSDADTHDTRSYAMPKMMKVVQDGGREVIVRSDKDVVLIVDPSKRSYREIGLAELEATAKAVQPQMEAAMAKMKERMAQMSPEQRAMVEKLMPQAAGGSGGKTEPVTVQKTNETKTIAGLNCNKYAATQNGKPVLTVWTTTEAPGFEGMKNDWAALQKRFSAINRGFGGAAEAFSQIQGFPMQTEMGSMKSTVTKVEARATPASAFEVPAGFSKEANPLPKIPPQ